MLKRKINLSFIHSFIRKDNQDFNNKCIEKANSEAELWKIANEAIKPKINSTIKLTINGESVVDEKEVAEAFNEYFIKKIDDLKDGIDQNLKKYPLEKLAEKMRDNRNKFSLPV